MNILLYHPVKETREMIGFCLESQMGLVVQQAGDFKDAINLLLEEGTINLVITSHEAETDKLFKYLLSTGAKIPVILVGDENSAQQAAFPDIKILAQLGTHQVTDKLLHVIRDNFEAIESQSSDEEYCRISTELLLRVVPLKGDIYIRLSSVKYVKFFRSGAQFTQEDFERFLHKKKITYLYLKKTESGEFVSKFRDDLSALVARAQDGDPALMDTVTEVQELIQELSNRVGFTEEVKKITQDNIQLAIKSIGASPKISKALSSSQLKNKNYLSSHSILLANIACSIAAQMQWPSNTTFHKLVLAALFHDFVFQDPELAKITTKQELEGLKEKLTDEQYNIVRTHPSKCSEVIKSLSEIPGDVDFLVQQHHERPNGSGFPKGLRFHQIPPLSALFIISHDMLNQILKDGNAFDMKQFLKDYEEEYQSGSFKKIWKALVDQENETAAPAAKNTEGGATKTAEASPVRPPPESGPSKKGEAA